MRARPHAGILRRIYDLVGNDVIRAHMLKGAEWLRIPKNILRVDTNNVCNIECIMCNNRPEKCADDRRMSLDAFKEMLDKLSGTLRFIYLSCSYEPLMTPRFIDYLACCRAKKIPHISFATNGLLLTDELIEFMVDEKIPEVILSFNGFTSEDYNRIMYRSSYDTIIGKLEKLREYKLKKGSELPALRMNTILMKSNILQFDRLAEFVKTWNIDMVQLRPLLTDETHNNNMEEIERENMKYLNPGERDEVAKNIRSHIDELSALGKDIILPAGFLTGGAEKIARHADSATCCIPFFSKWMDYRGNISVCSVEHGDAEIGNIFTDSPKTMGKKQDAFRKVALAGRCRKNCYVNINSSVMM